MDREGLIEMSDLINRQDAIDACMKYNGYGTVWACIMGDIKRLPSAQPERPEQPESAREYCAECDHIEMCQWYPYEGCEFRSLPSAQPKLAQNLHNACTNLISRQDALSCFHDWIDRHGDVHTADEMPEYQRIEQLPSAKPTYTDAEIQKMQDLEQAQIEKAYQLGYEKGKRDAQPEPKEIGYGECANAMLKMWIDNVLTDGEYNRIMDKLNKHWGKDSDDNG